MARDVEPLNTEWNGTKFRSRTEARWGVFFEELGIAWEYEPKAFKLSTNVNYLPDFYLTHFAAWFEVKPANDAVVTEECTKARVFARDHPDRKVWLAAGPPVVDQFNILPLHFWPADTIEDILGVPENRFQIQEDRRDEDIFWLHSAAGSGMSAHVIGGPGIRTTHDRPPMVHRRVEAAYKAAAAARF